MKKRELYKNVIWLYNCWSNKKFFNLFVICYLSLKKGETAFYTILLFIFITCYNVQASKPQECQATSLFDAIECGCKYSPHAVSKFINLNQSSFLLSKKYECKHFEKQNLFNKVTYQTLKITTLDFVINRLDRINDELVNSFKELEVINKLIQESPPSSKPTLLFHAHILNTNMKRLYDEYLVASQIESIIIKSKIKRNSLQVPEK